MESLDLSQELIDLALDTPVVPEQKEETLLDNLEEEQTVIELQEAKQEDLSGIKSLPVKYAEPLTKEEILEKDRKEVERRRLIKEIKDECPEIEEYYMNSILDIYLKDNGKTLERMVAKDKLEKKLESKEEAREKKI